jgi:AcrR family transcriptional regulator
MNNQHTETRTRLLDSAEQLFSERGIDATSLRAITTAADANLASVNYHFGSKDELFREVIARRIGPINAERLHLLEKIEREAGKKPLVLEAVLNAFLSPALHLDSQREYSGKHITCLMGRLYSEPRAEELKVMFFAEFKEVFERFIPALQCCLPTIAKVDILWRFFFMVGSMAHLMSASNVLSHASGGLCDPNDTEANLRRLVDFSAAGFRALPGNETPAAHV